MRNFLSLVAVAALVVTVGAGCGKFSKCSEATTQDDCKAGKFVDGVSCKWDGKLCVNDKPGNDDQALQAANSECAKDITSREKCQAQKPGAGFKCEFTEAKDGMPAKCTAAKA